MRLILYLNLNKLLLFNSCTGSPLRYAVKCLVNIYRVTFLLTVRGGARVQSREQKLPGLCSLNSQGK
jgi:hypothetical protein